jgi:capsular polysaccharide biosynthesis protein
VSVGGRFPAETISLIDFPFRHQYLNSVRALWAPARRVEDGYLLTLQQSANYYHFVCEVLPLAFALKRDDRWGQLPVYVGADLPGYVFEYLRLLGLDAYCRPLPRGVYAADTLRVATFPGLSSLPSPKHLLAVRQACLDAVGPSTRPRRRLYIRRTDAPDRRIVNEPKLLSALADFGFEPTTLSDKTLPEQIRLFQSAEIIIAPHGAGNTNLLFAPPDCVMIELMGPTIYSPSFLVIASTLGQPYGYVGCAERGRDVVVDPSAVRTVLDILLRARDAVRPDGD